MTTEPPPTPVAPAPETLPTASQQASATPPPLAWGVRAPVTQSQLEVAEHSNSRKLAIFALVLCLIPIPLTIIAGIVLAVVVLARGRRRAGSGFGLSIGALVAAALWILVAVSVAVWFGLGTFAPAERANGSTGQIVDSGAIDPRLLQVTDCLNVPAEGDVRSVKAIPCSEPHDGEVYSAPMLTPGAYPGEEAVAAEAEQVCVEEFAGYVGVAYDDSVLDMFYLYPYEADWGSTPSATCVVMSPDPLTGTMRLAKR